MNKDFVYSALAVILFCSVVSAMITCCNNFRIKQIQQVLQEMRLKP